eukprot:1755449-Pleurochrysis_carterae.AAC.1
MAIGNSCHHLPGTKVFVPRLDLRLLAGKLDEKASRTELASMLAPKAERSEMRALQQAHARAARVCRRISARSSTRERRKKQKHVPDG